MSLTSLELDAAKDTNMEDAERLYTADELLEISARDENRYELLHGRLRIMAPAGDVHGDMAMGVGGWMRVHADQNDLGKVQAQGHAHRRRRVAGVCVSTGEAVW